MRGETKMGTVLLAALVLPAAVAFAQTKASDPSLEGSPAPRGSLASATVSEPTSAPLPQQVVWLRSGAIVRGAIVEFVPDARIVLQLATGEIRDIPWDDVLRTSWVKDAAATPAASTSAPPTALPAAAPRPAASASGVLIHLAGDRPLRLEVRPRYGDGVWVRACDSPCDTMVDVHRKALRVTGPGTRPSNPFFIDAREGEETLDVRGGSAAVHRFGQGSLIAGIGLALAGGLAYGLGRVEDQDAAVVGGVVGMALGGIGIGVALPLLGTSSTIVRNGKGDRVGGRAGDRARF